MISSLSMMYKCLENIIALLLDLYIITYKFYISRDEGILYTGYLIANKTMINDWKNSWREGGLGAFYLFQTEFGHQVSRLSIFQPK